MNRLQYSQSVVDLMTRRETLGALRYRTAPSLRRLEQLGLLTPVKLSPRRVCYPARQVLELIAKGGV